MYPLLMYPLKSRRPVFPVLLVALFLGACTSEPTGPADPGTGADQADVPLDADFALQVAADEAVADMAVEDAALLFSEDAALGPWAEARDLFRRARRAWLDGDAARARRLALEGRRVLARALWSRRGDSGLDELDDLVDIAVERLDEAADEFARARELRDRLAALREEAASLRVEGHPVQAAERLIFALGIVDRLYHRRLDAPTVGRAVASRAVAAAQALLERVENAVRTDPDHRVRRSLAHATELVRRANAALDRQAWRRAVVLACRSVGWSLHALRLAGG